MWKPVWAVSDAEGKSRKNRKWGTPTDPGPYRKLPESRGGLLIKIIDRYANGKASKAAREKLSPKKQKRDKHAMYQKEHPGFYDALYVRDTPIQPVWDALNELLDYGS